MQEQERNDFCFSVRLADAYGVVRPVDVLRRRHHHHRQKYRRSR